MSQRVIEQLEVVAESHGLVLTCQAPEPVLVAGDPAWLGRLLLILLDNAIGFSPAGGHVTVAVHRAAEGACWEVADAGPGIPADVLPHVFEPFYRGSGPRPRGTEGTGLGLALAKWIVERHDGRITVASSPGEGSRFTVHLPLKQS